MRSAPSLTPSSSGGRPPGPARAAVGRGGKRAGPPPPPARQRGSRPPARPSLTLLRRSLARLGREHARVVLRRADDGVVVVASAKMAPGQYNLELVDDGAGNMKRNALLAFLGAPVLLFYYSLVLPRVFQD
eukprot:SM000106S14005  [mRNA]  locus=s106:447390:448015:- [translate_table: standard]